jgi:1,4-dihydroxy-2-naphthoate octaprenyltransferase
MSQATFQKNQTSLKSWLLASRPKTLTAAAAPVMVGSLLAKGEGIAVDWWLSLAALISSLLIQVATNLVNDAMDFKKGADTETRIGPTRVTQQGLLTSRTVLGMGVLFFFMSAVISLPLIAQGGWPIACVVALSILSGYIYTGGPYPLAYHGLGDLFVIIFFGLISTSAIYYVQTLKMSAHALAAGLQIGLLCTVMIAVNNLRDSVEDSKVGKNTLAVRFGTTFARAEITFLALVPFTLSLYWYNSGFYFAALLPWAFFPLAMRLVRNIWNTAPCAQYNNFLAQAALLHMMFSIFLCVGFMS